MTLAVPSDTYRAAAAVPISAPRESGLDALRAVMTLLVLFHHSAITYGASGAWFYREIGANESVNSKLLIAFTAVNQAYFMGLFFLIAGYFTPAAVARHGALGFLQDRLLRLGLPLLIFGFVIGPATIALAQTARGRPFWESLSGLWTRSYFEPGPLWFVEALLIFALLFVAWQALASRFFAAEVPASRFPSDRTLLLAALATGAVAFALRLRWPVGTQIFGLQLGYFASYVVLFAAGCLAAEGHLLRDIPRRQRRLWGRVALICGPLLFVLLLIGPRVGVLQGRPEGGWNAPALIYAFWEPLVAWGLILALLHTFQRRFVSLGPGGSALSRRAYLIYIIHPPVLVAVALAWRDVGAAPLLKFAVTGTVTCLACYVIAGALMHLPGVRRVV